MRELTEHLLYALHCPRGGQTCYRMGPHVERLGAGVPSWLRVPMHGPFPCERRVPLTAALGGTVTLSYVG